MTRTPLQSFIEQANAERKEGDIPEWVYQYFIHLATALLPAEKDCLKRAYSEGVNLGMREVSRKVNDKLDVTVDAGKHFTTFYSQYENDTP